MGKQHRRGRATRLDALRPDVHGTGTGVLRQADAPAYRPSAPASRNQSQVHTRLATAGPSRSAAALAFGWEQVRRRKLGQWGVLYATGAWGFLQGLGYLTELFAWPNELPRVVALALLAGLPEVLVVAWFHGDRGDQRVTGTELALITLLFLLGGSLFWAYQHAGNSVEGGAVEHTRPGPAGDEDPRPVVAVLPFENRSEQRADAHFVDGVHDDLLTQLTKVGSLRVVARTSVVPFRGSSQSTQQIATTLGATMLVEGGVQRSGGRVRVTVQLVDGGTAVHLWADHYDRELSATNALEVQSEVAAAVSDALKDVLTSSHVDGRVVVSTTAPTPGVGEGRVAEVVRLP
jgi:TolB-like protein